MSSYAISPVNMLLYENIIKGILVFTKSLITKQGLLMQIAIDLPNDFVT